MQAAESRIFTPQLAEAGGSLSGSGAQGYWRKPSGEIVFGSFTTNGFRVNTRKRFMPLMEYGEFTNDLHKRTKWDPMLDPYRPILERGGIKEFTREQIVEFGWHRKPHHVLAAQIERLVADGIPREQATVAVIPQLAGFERVDVPCSICPGRVFNSEDELKRHEILHKDDVQTRRLGDAITQALAGGQAAQNETMTPILKMLAEAIQSLSVNQAEIQANLANVASLVKGATDTKK
jgi:hypothetical protein